MTRLVYLRTPHIGRTKASDVACPAPSPPSLSPNFSPVTTTTKLAGPISHQISSLRSPIRCRRDCSFRFLLSLSLRFRFREPLVLLWDSLMCSADEIRFRYLSHSFSSKFRFSDEILSAAAIADVCRLRDGRSKLSIRRTKFSAAGAGTLGRVGARGGTAAAGEEGARCEKVAQQLCRGPTNQMAGCDNGQWEI